jgi:hypothetical protein
LAVTVPAGNAADESVPSPPELALLFAFTAEAPPPIVTLKGPGAIVVGPVRYCPAPPPPPQLLPPEPPPATTIYSVANGDPDVFSKVPDDSKT